MKRTRERTRKEEILSDVAGNSRESRSLHQQTRSLLSENESKLQKNVDFLANLLAEGISDATTNRRVCNIKLDKHFEQQRTELSRLTREFENLEATNKEHLDLLTKREDHIVKCMEKTTMLCHKMVLLLSANIGAEALELSSAKVETGALSRKRKAVPLQ